LANNVFQIKRTSTSGRTPNTTSSSNSQYINAGEFALNMTDKILYTSDGTNLITIGSNTVNQSVTGNLIVKAIVANGSLGTAGQVLSSNGSATYWSSSSGGGGAALPARQIYTANGSANTFTVTGGYYANNLDVYINGVKLVNGTDVNTASGSTFTILGSNPPNNAIIEVVGTSSLTTTGVSTVVNQQITANGTANSFAITNGYIANSIAVFLNGVKQIPGVDVITTSGSNVNFIATPANNDVIDVYGYQTAVSYTSNSLIVNSITFNDSTTFNSASSLGTRNRIINGNMGIDQRNNGASQTITAAAALAYTVDRWYAYCTGANVTGQQITNTGTTASPSQKSYQFTGAASVTAIGFAQRIEAVNSYDLANTTATLSVNLSNSLLTTVTWTAYYANSTDTFGTLASPTRTQIATGSFTVTSTLTRYSTTISIPSAATTGIEIVFTVGAQTSGTWAIGNVQLEAGSVATPFERRQYTTELLLCQRYYNLMYCEIGGVTASGIGLYISYNYPTIMRATPTTSTSTPTLAGSCTGFGVGTVYNNSFEVAATNTSGGSGIARMNVYSTAEL